MAGITQILFDIEAGDSKAAAELLPLVYDELRKLAAVRLADEKPGQTLQPTALVNEAYLRLVGGEQPEGWNGRGHFFAAAAEAMRRILVNRARDKGRIKRGGGHRRQELVDLSDAAEASPDDLLDLNDALDRLAVTFPDCAELVKLRFFAGLSLADVAATLGLSRRTIDNRWVSDPWVMLALIWQSLHRRRNTASLPDLTSWARDFSTKIRRFGRRVTLRF